MPLPFELAHSQAPVELAQYIASLTTSQLGIEPELLSRLVRYLLQYGYLLQGDTESALQDPADLTAQIRVGVEDLENRLDLPHSDQITTQVEGILALPRCGNGDSLAIAETVRKWGKSKLNYFVKSYVPGLPRDVQDGIFAQAYQSWSDVAGITFHQVTTERSCDILIVSSRIDGVGRVLAQALLPPGNNSRLWMQLDDGEVWRAAGGQAGTLLLNVFCHETGHNLGLDHSRISTALMAPFYSAGIPRPQQNDDIPRIQSLYGPPSSTPAPTPTPVPGDPEELTLTVRFKGRSVLSSSIF